MKPMLRSDCGGASGRWFVVTRLARAVIGCVSATLLAGVAPIAAADTFTYELNGSYAESNGGSSLVPYGGTLGPDGITGGLRGIGYNFAAQQGLSLSGIGIFDVYTIAIRFYLDDVNASFNTYEKILDFKNRTSDSGLYSLSGSLQLFASTGSGDPHEGTIGHVFQMARWPTC
jgi:hypothetical protein